MMTANDLSLQAQTPRPSLWRDARHFQILYLGGFLLFGILALGWQAELMRYALLISTCLITQMIWTYFTTQNYTSWKSGLITALGLCLLLKSNQLWVLGLAGTLAISSKFLIRYRGKHLFNPANLGIIAAIVLTGDAWISPGQWGNTAIFLFLIGVTGSVVLFKVGRLDTCLSFLLTFALLLFIQNVLYKGWPLDHWLHSLTNGSLLLFTFFMITDPATTPNARKARILWAAGIGVFAFILTSWQYVHTAPIWALIIYAPITAFLDRYFQAKKFAW
ncbi:MAG: RnfABCDGE type electron transport complex subunit D [Bacteroidota bacterium]